MTKADELIRFLGDCDLSDKGDLQECLTTLASAVREQLGDQADDAVENACKRIDALAENLGE